MEIISISSQPREPGGKGVARRLRAAGRTPAVVYGHGIDNAVAISMDPRDLDRALDNPKRQNALVDLDVAGTTHRVLLREIQRHPVSRAILHLDFVAPKLDQAMVAAVPVRVTGKSVGVVTGGKLRKPYREVKLSALPAEIPAEIVLDVTELDHGDSIKASDMPMPEGASAVFDRDYVVVKVSKPRGLDEDFEEGEGEGETATEGEPEAEA